MKRLFILLDEVTSVRGWWRVLRYYVNTGVLDRAVVIATGSSTVGLLKTPERFPGSRGGGKDVVVMPLDFPAYVKIHGVDFREPAALSQLFEEYLETGGFPKAVNKHPDAQDAVIDAVVSEAYRHGKSPQLLKDILGAVVERIPSPMSYHAVAQEVGVSHNTVREYIEFLADIYVVGLAYLLSGGKPQPRREKKIFFRDPLLYRAAAQWTSRRVDEAALLEQVVQEHLFRRYGQVYYYRNKTEIDVVAGPHKIEVKSQRPRRGYPKDVIVLSRSDAPRFLMQLQGVS